MLARVKGFINEWTHGPDWKTWVAHSTIALTLSLFLGWQAALGYYFLRECEQILYGWVDHDLDRDWLDHFMDVAAPAAVLLVVSLAIRLPVVPIN